MEAEKLMMKTLTRAADGAVKAAAKLAPKRQFDFLVTRRTGPWFVDAWRVAPGYYWVQVGHWCLEVAWNTNAEMRTGASSR